MGAIEETQIFFKTVGVSSLLTSEPEFELKVSPFPYGPLYCPNTIVLEKIPPFPLVQNSKKIKSCSWHQRNLRINFIWIE
jgi:hypothetical protein